MRRRRIAPRANAAARRDAALTLCFRTAHAAIMPTTPATSQPPRLQAPRIAAARARIDACFLDSPLHALPVLSRRFGCRLQVKDETANPVGCFKGRGATNLLASIGDDEALVCASAGNFGLAMAYGCAQRGLALTVFAADGANSAKIAGIRAHGATVVTQGHDFDAAKEAARAFATRHGQRFVEDGRDPEITEGAGTIACELLAQGEAPDAVLVPLGNGALLAGIGCWLRAHAGRTEVIGVCSRGAPVMAQCWRAGRIPCTARDAVARTIADGIAVRVPVRVALEDLRDTIDDVVCVDDDALVPMMRALRDELDLQAEPAAVVGLAAIDADPRRFADRRVLTVITGRNLSPAQIRAWYG
jgi:threonine dehydratase